MSAADDHCQRYQGITKIVSKQAEEAVRETRGMVITYQGEICDARYSKACGGITEEFDTAWDDKRVPYLESISDAPVPHQPDRDGGRSFALDSFGARGLLQHKRRRPSRKDPSRL